MPTPRILFDGHPLCTAPLSPPALHLLEVLAHFPAGFEAHVALTQPAPGWLAGDFALHVHEISSRLAWEQSVLPRLAGRLGAGLHLTDAAAPLFTDRPAWLSPAGADAGPPAAGLGERLRRSLGRGGASRASRLWPSDAPAPAGAFRLAPCVHPDYRPVNRFRPPEIAGLPEIPESFVLVQAAPDPAVLQHALDAWTWAAGPVGELYPLLFIGLPEESQDFVRRAAAERELGETVFFFPAPPPSALHLIYQSATAVFHPAPVGAWTSPLRLGIACGVPVVAHETPISSAIAGPAAYLVAPGDARRLGAALLAVIVREDIRKQLMDAARRVSKEWSGGEFQAGLAEMYAGAAEAPGAQRRPEKSA